MFFFITALAALAVFFVLAPVVLYSLMLETCESRRLAASVETLTPSRRAAVLRLVRAA